MCGGSRFFDARDAGERRDKVPKFWDWMDASDDTEQRAVLVLSGPIDTGESWYEDGVYPAKFREELAAHAGEAIQVEINSPGGDVFAGFEIYNMLLAHEGSVRVRVVGLCASAASIIAMSADAGELIMCETSMMMIHNPWTYAAGNSGELREQADVLDLIRDVMVEAYMHRFGGTQEELVGLLDADTYLTPARAMELGLCDAIEGPEDETQDAQAAAAAMLGRYAAMSGETAARLRAALAPGKRARAKLAREHDAHTHGETTTDPLLARQLLDEADAIIARLM